MTGPGADPAAHPALTVAVDEEGAAEACAELLARLIDEARAERGEAHVALAGGSTPRRTYELLVGRLASWGGVHLWYGDERVTDPHGPDSNHAMVAASLLSGVGVSPDHEHRVPVEHGARDAAALYADELRATVPLGPGGVPRLDVALLGMGPDGHTASLFPGDPALREDEALCAAVLDAPKPPPERVTLTVTALRAARRVVILATGPEKRLAVEALLSGPDPGVPASLVIGAGSEILVDAEAAPKGDLEGERAAAPFHHVAVETRAVDGDRSRDFYALLGFAEIAAPEGLRGRARWLERGAQQIHLMLVDDPVAAPEGHFAVVVDDYEAAVERLRAGGHEVEPRTEHWGSPRSFVRDPTGHRVELMAFPPS